MLFKSKIIFIQKTEYKRKGSVKVGNLLITLQRLEIIGKRIKLQFVSIPIEINPKTVLCKSL